MANWWRVPRPRTAPRRAAPGAAALLAGLTGLTGVVGVVGVTGGLPEAGAAVSPEPAPVTARVCARKPVTADPRATPRARALLQQLFLLTCNHTARDGVVSGQNLGHGPEPADPAGPLGYTHLVQDLADRSGGRRVGVVGVDYEHDHVFTPAQLSAGNQVLIEHARRGGLVTVNFSPQSPWLNDESDLVGHPGVWTDTRTDAGQLTGVHLADLLDPGTAAGRVWQRKLARIADALTELRDADVPVLWRPMQEMNGFWFWWGTTLQPDGAATYTAIWRSMFHYLTEVRGLHNLLWVYSPSSFPPDPAQQESLGIHSAAWAYPGTDLVDVVAGTAYSADLTLPNYAELLALPEVVGAAEYGPGLTGTAEAAGALDTRRYAQRLHDDYPAVAYWVSWHDYPVSATETVFLSLAGNRNAAELLADPYVIGAGDPRLR